MHYAVAVFREPGQRVSELLAPYSKNYEVEPYIDMTFDEVKAYLATFKPIAGLTDDEIFEVAKKVYDPVKVDEDRNFYTTENPHARFDYYEVGGRFSRYFPYAKVKVSEAQFTYQPTAFVTPSGEWVDVLAERIWSKFLKEEAKPDWEVTIVDCHW